VWCRASEDRSIASLGKPLSGASGESRKFIEQTEWLTSVPTAITIIIFKVKYEINHKRKPFLDVITTYNSAYAKGRTDVM
jgi:hypothetical protein